jgi:ssDNA-binding Zn-finger/Zn-ribbon topoisomerase 1
MSTMEMVPAADVARGLMLHGGAGTLAMAVMPDEEFGQRLAALKKGAERIRTIKRELMTEGSHYGTIPGTDKPTLLKPGAEVLCSIYGLRPDFVPTVEYGDGHASPPIRVTMRCELHLGDMSGPVVAVGYGAANSWERKHRWRRGERACPECGSVGTVIRGKADFGGGWLCWAKKGGCGVKWATGAPEIEGQAVSDIENTDQHDLENTLVKMAKKRAFLDATLTGTASSDLFTQDLEEQDHVADEPKPAPAAQKRQAAAPPQPATDPEYPNDTTAYERHGVDPAPPRHTSGQTSGQKQPCPQCGSAQRVNLSKFPKKGIYYCGACNVPFGPKG